MRVALFKDSQISFLQGLNEARIPFEELKAAPGGVMASEAMVIIARSNSRNCGVNCSCACRVA